MHIYKLLNFNFILLATSTLILSACQLPKPESRKEHQQTAASFYVDTISAELIETKLSEKISIPNSKTFRIKACLKDLKQSKAIINGSFEVSENSKLETDTTGCINWSEKLNFNVFSEPKYLEIVKVIKSTGLHQGQTEAKFALNPWVFDKSAPEFIDLSRTSASPLVSGKENVQLALTATSNEFVNSNNLWVEDGRLFASENDFKNGVNISYEVKITPQIQIKSLKGEKVFLPLTIGRFKAAISIFNSIGDLDKSKKALLAKGDQQEVQIEKNTLTVKSTLKFNFIPDRGQNYLILDLEPLDAPKELKKIKSVFFIGEYDQIKSTAFLKVNAQYTELANQQKIKFEQDLTQNEELNSQSKNNPESYQRAKIEVAPLEFKFVRVANETTTDRDVIFNIRACLKNGIDQKPLRHHSFKIQKLKMNESDPSTIVEQKTDNNSCLSWDESISIQYWKCQHFMKGQIAISNDDLGMNEKLGILVNPWEFWGLMARDERYIDPSLKNPMNCDEKNQNSQLVIDSVAMNTASFRYELDNNMNLILFKKLKFIVNSNVLMHSNLAMGRRNNEALRDGIYLLRMAIVKNINYNSQYNLITHQDKLVLVTDGHIATDVEFKIDNLKSIGDRNSIIIEVFPIKENMIINNNGILSPKNNLKPIEIVNFNSGLTSQPVAGYINLSIDDGARAFSPINWANLTDYLINPKYKDAPNTSLISQILENEKLEKTQQLKNYNSVTYSQKDNLNIISLKYSYTYTNLLQSLGIDVAKLMRFKPLFDSQFPAHYHTYKQGTKPANLEVLKRAIDQGSLDVSLAQSLCVYWFNEFMPSQQKNKTSILLGKGQGALTNECIKTVKTKVSDFFKIEKKYFVYNNSIPTHKEGRNYALNVGTNFSLSNASSETIGSTLSGSASGGLKIPFGKALGEFLNAGANLSYQVSKGEQDSKSHSNAINISFGTQLSVDDLSFKIKLNQYEKCLAIRLNPSLFTKNHNTLLRMSDDYLWVFNPELTSDEKLKYIHKGILICPGEITQRPIEKIEKYYILNQEYRQSYGQDNGNSLNRHFFVTLRGQKDFERFKNMIEASANIPESSSAQDNSEKLIADKLKDLLLLSPSFPGVYSE